MNILLVILHAQPSRGGAERYTHDLATQLIAGGHNVSTAATSFDPDWPGEQLRIPPTGLSRTAQYNSFLDGVEALRRSRPNTVIHAMLPIHTAHLYHPHAGIMALRKRPSLAEFFNRRRHRMAQIERTLVPQTLTIALSNYSLSHFRIPYPNGRAEVLLNGVDLNRFDPETLTPQREQTRQQWGLKNEDIAALCIAQDFERKGVPIAVRALSLLKSSSTKLIIVGKDDPAPILTLAKALGVQDRVVIAGPMKDVRPAYAGADLFVLPTHHDPCPLVTIEALACGLPVISTRFNGACQYMTQNVHGVVVEDLTPDAIAGGLEMFSNNQTRANAKAECLKLRNNLDVIKHVEKLEGLYQHAASGQ